MAEGGGGGRKRALIIRRHQRCYKIEVEQENLLRDKGLACTASTLDSHAAPHFVSGGCGQLKVGKRAGVCRELVLIERPAMSK